ncbi:MAG: ADOP family duplicated permease [Bryobacteraceae bacterium]
MRSLRAFLLRLGGSFRKSRGEKELADEMESHLQLQITHNLRAGMSPENARREALLKSGGIESAKEEYRNRRSLPALETIMQDLRYAARTLTNNAGFTAVAVLTLGLGIGANTAMFSVVQAVLWRPLPYAEPDRLVEISETNPLKRWTHTVAAPANFADWQKMNTVFTGMAGYAGVDKTGESHNDLFITGQGEPLRLKGLVVTGNLFDILGVAPLLGRTFRSQETFTGKDRVAILTYDLWQTQFAGDPHILGRSISLNGKNYDVVGVMPRGFFFPSHAVQIFVPFGFKPSVFVEQRRPHSLSVIARLRSGITLAQASDQMKAIASRLEQTYPDTNSKMGVRLDGFHATLTEDKRPALLMLLAAVGLLFLIVCSNVANLQLGRAAVRAREFEIRQALGAGRGRLIRQLLTESLVLSLLGGVSGFVLAAAARGALLRYAPSAIPRFAELRIDDWVIAFNVILTLAAPLLFGVVPALASSRSDTLRDRSRITSRGNRSLRNILVACEVALSVLLVAGAGLLIRSLIRLENVDPGFNPDHAISFNILLPGVRYPKEEQVARFVQDLEQSVRAQPQVQAVGTSLTLALRGYAWTADATVEGRPNGEYERELRHNCVTPDYFRAMGTPLLRGRYFNGFDTLKSQPVTIVNQALEDVYFHRENAVGKRIKFGRPNDKGDWVTIVGVVADEKQDGVDARVQPEAYQPFAQNANEAFTAVIRGTSDPSQLVSTARRTVQSLDKDLALTDVTPLSDLVHASVGDQRFRASLLSCFASIALFLAALGVYGVLAYSVAQRSREIGIRRALGASTAGLFGMLVRDGMRPVIGGALVGLIGAYGITRLLKSMLFGVTATDPPTYLLTIATLAVVALCACAVPAWRALRVEPLISLRDQ